MRRIADKDLVLRFMRELGRASSGETRVYFAGGASAVLIGWRPTTIDVDIKIDPENDCVLRAIPRLKEELQINVELASPDQFIPVPSGWRERSVFIEKKGGVAFHHFDFYSQALSKIERGHRQDLEDVLAMKKRRLILKTRLLDFFSEIEPLLYKHPAIDSATFRRAVAKIAG